MTDEEKFNAVCEKPFKDQIIFFLNAFWPEFGDKAEEFWQIYQKFLEFDAKEKNGKSLNEFDSHRLLEHFGEPLTVIQFREVFRGIDKNFDKRMGAIEYLVYRYKVTIKELVSRPQGTNEDLEKASRELELVQQEIDKIEQQKKKLEAEASGEGFKAIRAKNELAQLLSKDQTDLNRALISAQAAVKKARKSQNVAAQGAFWFVERELEEAKKYKPKSNLTTIFHEKEKK